LRSLSHQHKLKSENFALFTVSLTARKIEAFKNPLSASQKDALFRNHAIKTGRELARAQIIKSEIPGATILHRGADGNPVR
jgi:hypothetical protein